MNYYLSIDIGASSGRHMLSWIEGQGDNRKICMEEIYRFKNGAAKDNDGSLVWDIKSLEDNVIEGIKACSKAGKIPCSIGIDTWAVDYVLLDKAGNILGKTYCYRDNRTDSIPAIVDSKLEKAGLGSIYQRTGIQFQKFNTVYQLGAVQKETPELLAKADCMLMLPDYLGYVLTGIKKQEYTNATSTSLVNVKTHDWDMEMIKALGYPENIFLPLTDSGTVLGNLRQEVRDIVGFDCKVSMCASHDTASAFLSVPVKADSNEMILSSGTWSLMGIESQDAIVTEQGQAANFTNEGGYCRTTRFLKNIAGMWMMQQVSKELDISDANYTEEIAIASNKKHPAPVIDVNDPAFLSPVSMVQAIKDYCVQHDQYVPEDAGDIYNAVYVNLARVYKTTFDEIESISGKKYTAINIIGGGSKNKYVCQMMADSCGVDVNTAHKEGTALGNAMMQMIAMGDFKNVEEARKASSNSFDKYTYRGNNNE